MIDDSKAKIGGPGIEVEVDESKFAKRKYHRGHRVGSKDWVLGGIEKHTRPTELKKQYFAVIVEDRSRTTIEPIFCQYNQEGSIVSSNFWKAYNWMGEKESGYVNPQMGTNTLWLRGVPKCEIFCLPPPFHTGTPHMVTGTVF